MWNVGTGLGTSTVDWIELLQKTLTSKCRRSFIKRTTHQMFRRISSRMHGSGTRLAGSLGSISTKVAVVLSNTGARFIRLRRGQSINVL